MKLDMKVDTDYKSLYRKTRLNLMKYADELTDLEEIYCQMRLELETYKETGMTKDQIKRLLERVKR